MRTLAALLLLLLFVAVLTEKGVGQSTYDLRSPDGRIEIRIRTVGQIRYDVVLRGRAVLENSTCSLDVEHKKLGVQPKVIDAKQRSADQVVEPVVRQKFAKIRDHYNELTLNIEGGYAVVFRAYNEGAAYRFETSMPQGQVKIYGEESNFNFPANFVVYYPQEDSFFSHNERKYLPQHLSEIVPASLATLPAVVDVGEGAKVAIAESDVDDYPGLWLKATGGNGLAATFPPYPLKESLTGDRDYKVVESADYIAITAGTRTFPWRVIGIADRDGDLLTNQIVYLLENPRWCKTHHGSSQGKWPGTGGTPTMSTAWTSRQESTRRLINTTSTLLRNMVFLTSFLMKAGTSWGTCWRSFPKSTWTN